MGSEQMQRTADVVVVGSGAAGCVAALRAAAAGSSVVVLEAADKVGGTTARSSGGYWIPNNSLMRARGLQDPREDALRYMAKLSFPERYHAEAENLGLLRRDYDLLAAFYDHAAEAIDWLSDNHYLNTIEMIGFDGRPGDFPPYFELPELDRAPYGRHLGAAYDEAGVAAMAGTPMRGQGGLEAAVGGQGDGRELIRQLSAALARSGVEVLLEHRAREVTLDEGGGARAVIADSPAGMVTIDARRGVVFASGGFSASAEHCERYLLGPIYGSGAAPSCVGDFIEVGLKVGAELGNLQNAWWCQVPLEPALRERIMDWLMFVPFGDAMIMVDRHGRRVVNEKAMYNERAPAHFLGGREAGFPNRVLMMVYDDAVAESPVDWPSRWPIPLPDGEMSLRASDIDVRALVISGANFQELAENISERLRGLADGTGDFALDRDFAAQLHRTVETFNGYARAGLDPEFHRGETRAEREQSGPARAGNDRNQTMFPFRMDGSYHCILVAAGTLETKGGPRVDTRARVMRPDGKPVPRLYGAGNCIANPTARAYWSGGATLGTAITLGYIAGTHVSREAAHDQRQAAAGG